MSGANSPGGPQGAGAEPMDEDAPQQQEEMQAGQQQDEQQEDQQPQQQQPAASGQRPANSGQTGSALVGAGSQQATPRPPRRQRPQPQPSGSLNQQAASDGTAGTAGGATPLPRGANNLRGELGGRSGQRRPQVRVGTAGRAASVSTALPGLQQGLSGDMGDQDLPPANDDAGDDGTYVWGTNINSRQLREQINGFLRNFRPAGASPDSRPKYVQIIQEAIESGETSVNIDTNDMRAIDPDTGSCWAALYETLVDFPREVHCVLDEVVREVAVLDLNFEAELQDRQQAMDLCLLVCRPYNLAATKHIRDLDPVDIDRLVCIKGMVTRTSSIIPNLRYATFECASCGAEVSAPNVAGRVEDPTSCAGCKKKWSMVLAHNKGSYTDKQLVKMQESPNDIPEGETPMGVTLYSYDTLVDVARPGDRVTITGIYRAAAVRANPRMAALNAMFRTYVDVVHVHRDETRRLFSTAGAEKTQDAEPTILSAPNTPADSQNGEPPASQPEPSQAGGSEEQFTAIENITAEELKEVEGQIKELSKDPRLVERLIASLAPNIWEMEDIKKGVLCQLFGGVRKEFPGGKIRGEMNVLLVGDPSTSKSQLLTYVHQLAPRGIYTSGKGSSAVGLTAYVTRDPETNEMVLESGALVLSDRGVCCIDEFDKMSDSARSMLHEAMEQQTVSVAKAGLISTLNARCSVLACANPIGSRYNPAISLSDNINLPCTLLTRFDLIYLVLDRYEEARDRRLARHLVSLFYPGAQGRTRASGAVAATGGGGPPALVAPDLLKKYIAYARARCQPKLTDEAAEELVARYQTLRRNGREKKVMMATPRQLESLIRIAESLARMRLDEEITVDDVGEAVRLWYDAMQSATGIGGGNGRVDLDALYTGTTAAQREAARTLPDNLRMHFTACRITHTLSLDDLLRDFNSKMAQVAAQQGNQGGDQAPLHHISRGMMLEALRQLDDLIVLDDATNTVRPVLRAVPNGTAAAASAGGSVVGGTEAEAMVV